MDAWPRGLGVSFFNPPVNGGSRHRDKNWSVKAKTRTARCFDPLSNSRGMNELRRIRMTASTDERIEYYRDQNVRARIVEFLGGNVLETPTCSYVVGGDTEGPRLDRHLGVRALDSLFDEGFEICRSLWDETSLLADFDIEYVNFDHPAEVFLEPEHAFEVQEPVAAAVERTLNDYGISPLHLLSGRGHHFVWRIQRDSEAFRRLVKLGRGPESLWTVGCDPRRN